MTETIIISIITALGTGGLTWLFTIKYTRKQAEADAMKSLQEVYKEIIADLKDDRADKQDKINNLELRITAVEQRSEENSRVIVLQQKYTCGLATSCTKKTPFEYKLIASQ